MMKPCALLTINHEGHNIFWDAVGARKIKYPYYGKFYLRQIGVYLIDSNCETYLVEDLTPLKYMKHRPLFRKKKVIDVVADGLAYVYLTRPEWYYNEIGQTHVRLPKLVRDLHLNSVVGGLSILNGAIAVSSLVKHYLSKLTNVPIGVVPPSISSKKIPFLESANPKLEAHNIVSVGSGTWKGIDLMIDAFKVVLKEYPDSKLFLKIRKSLFESYKKKISNVNNVNVILKKFSTKDYVDFLSSNSIYLQTSYFDPHPVSVSEAMTAGIIPIVTNMVGTKDLFQDKYKSLVAKVDKFEIADSILKVFDMPISKKRKISKRMRVLARQVYPEVIKERFAKEYKKIIDQL